MFVSNKMSTTWCLHLRSNLQKHILALKGWKYHDMLYLYMSCCEQCNIKYVLSALNFWKQYICIYLFHVLIFFFNQTQSSIFIQKGVKLSILKVKQVKVFKMIRYTWRPDSILQYIAKSLIESNDQSPQKRWDPGIQDPEKGFRK